MQFSMPLLFVHVLVLCLIGCAQGDATPSTASADVDFPVEASAKPFRYKTAERLKTTVFTDAEFITAARKVMVQDDYVIVGDSRGDTLVRVFDTTGRHLGSLGRNGRGPGEFTTVWWMTQGLPSNPGIWFFDIGNQRLVHHDFSEYPENIVDGDPLSIQINHEGFVAFIEWLDDRSFIGAGRIGEGRFAVFNTEGSSDRAIGSLPDFRSDAPTGVRQQGYTGYVVRHPTEPLLVEVTRYADRLVIYDFDGTVLHTARTTDPFEPDEYMRILMDEQPARGEALVARYGFLDVTANDEVIYALFSGRNDATSNYSRSVYAFDWEGNFLKAYELDTDVISITLAPSGKSLFAVRHNPTPAILEVAL